MDNGLRRVVITGALLNLGYACALWLGGFLEEYPSLESIIEAAGSEGYEIHGLTHDVVIALTKESGTPTPPSVGEQLGAGFTDWAPYPFAQVGPMPH